MKCIITGVQRLLGVLLLGALPLWGLAQSNCSLDSTLANGPIISPAVLVDAMGCEYYEEAIQFVLPQDSVTSGVRAVFIDFVIDSVVGLPQGMDWVCNLAPGCRYVVHPDSANIDTLGCVTMFGTPSVPATYQVSVSLTSTFVLLGQTVSQPFTFALPLQVTPCSFVGDCYTLATDGICEPMMLSITNNVPSNGNTGYRYNMTLTGDNGFLYQTRDERPADQMLTAGEYVFSYELEIDTIGYLLSGVTIDAIDCDDLLGDPDLYWVLKDPQGNDLINTSSNPIGTPNSNLPLNTGISGISLTQGLYEFQVWDDDGNNDQGCATGSTNQGSSVFFSIPGTTGTQTVSNGGLTVTLIIDRPLQTVACSDTFVVNPAPEVPMLLLGDSTQPGDTILVCGSDRQTLLAEGDSVRWAFNGMLIDSTVGNTYEVMEAGTYQAVAVDPSTFCTTFSSPLVVEVATVPAPSIGFNGRKYKVANPQAGLSYEWIDENNAVAGNGVEFTPSGFGNYGARTVDPATGCVSEVSVRFVFIPTSLQALPQASLQLAPNPAVDAANLTNLSTRRLQGTLSIHDLQGRTLQATEIDLSTGETLQLQRQGMAEGLYLLRLVTPTTRWQQKLVWK